jgi:hypothetical protein
VGRWPRANRIVSHLLGSVVSLIGERHWLTGWLERERGLAYANTQIVSKPVGHFLKGITVFEAPSENGFHGAWQISHLWAYRQYDLIDGSIGPDLPFFRDGPVTIIEVANVPKPLGNDAFRDHLDRTPCHSWHRSILRIVCISWQCTAPSPSQVSLRRIFA